MVSKKVTDEKMVTSQSEDNMQYKIWQRLWRDYPFLRRRVWHVANQRQNKQEASRVQSMGVLSGVWDLHMYFRGQFVIFEGKVGNNQLSVDRIVNGRKVFGQREWGEIMVGEGAWSYVFREEEQFFQCLHDVFKRLNFEIPK